MRYLLRSLCETSAVQGQLQEDILHAMCFRRQANQGRVPLQVLFSLPGRPRGRHNARFRLPLQPNRLFIFNHFRQAVLAAPPKLSLLARGVEVEEATPTGIQMSEGTSTIIFFGIIRGDAQVQVSVMRRRETMSIAMQGMRLTVLCGVQSTALQQGRMPHRTFLQLPTHRQSQLYLRYVRNQHLSQQRRRLR